MVSLAVGASVAALSQPAAGCAPAPPAGEQVVTQREDALIVWDAPNRREHFVRRAAFGGVSKEFGFLVPAPSRPELAEASEAAFSTLAQATAPAVVSESRWVAAPVGCTMLPWLFLGSRSKAAEPLPRDASSVTLLEEKRVAGLDATVLEASSADALAAWLEARGFAFRPALMEWVQPYLRAGWTITAFRYAAGARLPASNLASSALRMSFVTDAPLYPYREPADQPSVTGRELRLFLLAAKRLEPAAPAGATWPLGELFSAPLVVPAALREALPGVPLASSMWLVELRDRTRKRAALDFTFVEAAARREVRPPPVIVLRERPLPIPYEAPILLGGAAWWWQRRRRRNAAE